MRVAIFGCGPAGLLAAHAAVQNGHEPDIYSRKEKSHIHGAQYIHEPVHDITGTPTVISYAKLGDSGGYAEKVYGSPLAPSSWASFPQGEYPAWPMNEVYDELWLRYSHLVRPSEVRPEEIQRFMDTRLYDIVFTTLPARDMCHQRDKHRFTAAEVAFEPRCYAELDNVVIYSGRETEPWYRTSSLFGHGWTEYGIMNRSNQEREMALDRAAGWMHGIKPIDTDCDCHSYPNLIRLGRFGRWEKKVLVTDAYKEAEEALFEREVAS